MAATRRAQAHAGAAVLPAPPDRTRGTGPGVARVLPSGRSLAVGFSLLALGVGAYAGARGTSIFAVRTIEVTGAGAPVAAQVRGAVDGVRGTSLVGLDETALLRSIEAVPAVASATFDRAFPHTLRIAVRAEQPVAVLRRGRDDFWLVSARGRVLERLRPRTLAGLPRIWVPRAATVTVGARLDDKAGGAEARALASLVRVAFPARIATVALTHDELVFRLGSGVALRLGRPDDLRLKLAVARRIVAGLPAGIGYLDVSVPERPVAGNDPKVSG